MMTYTPTLYPRIRYIEDNAATGEYALPHPIEEFRVSLGRNQQLVEIPLVNGGNIYGPSWAVGRISIRGEMQRVDAAAVRTALAAMKTAAMGQDVSDNLVRIFSQYNRAGGLCVWYEGCKLISMTFSDVRGTPYRPWVWCNWALEFYMTDENIYYDAAFTGSAGQCPAAQGPTTPDTNTVSGSMVVHNSLSIKNSSTGLTHVKIDSSGNIQFTGTLTNPTSIT